MITLGQNDEATSALNQILTFIRNALGWLGQANDASGNMRTSIQGGTLPTVTTVGTVTSITTLANQTQVGSMNANDQIPTLMTMTAQNLRQQITVQ